jgi:hypothetical protein
VFVIEQEDGDVDWIFTNRGSDFWGFCCDDGSNDAFLDQKFDQLFNPGAMAAQQRQQCGEQEDERCAGVNCQELMAKIKALDEEIAVLDAEIAALQKRLDALLKENPTALDELGEAADLQHQIEAELTMNQWPLLAAMSGLLAEWLDCCSDRAVDEFMQGIIAHYVKRFADSNNENRTGAVLPQHPTGEFVNLTPFTPAILDIDISGRCSAPLDVNDTLLFSVPDTLPPVEFVPSDHLFLLQPLPAPHGTLQREEPPSSTVVKAPHFMLQ